MQKIPFEKLSLNCLTSKMSGVCTVTCVCTIWPHYIRATSLTHKVGKEQLCCPKATGVKQGHLPGRPVRLPPTVVSAQPGGLSAPLHPLTRGRGDGSVVALTGLLEGGHELPES